EVALSVPLYVHASQRRAIDEGDRYLARHLVTWAAAAEAWRGVTSPAYPAYAHMADVIRASTPERVRGYRGVGFGGREAVRDAIEQLREQFGVDQILWQVDFGAMPPAASHRNLRAFVDQVLEAA